MLKVNKWRRILLGLGPMTLTCCAVCAHTFARINFYAQDHSPNRGSYGVLAANKNELARACERVSVLVPAERGLPQHSSNSPSPTSPADQPMQGDDQAPVAVADARAASSSGLPTIREEVVQSNRATPLQPVARCCGPGCWCCELAERALKDGLRRWSCAALVWCWRRCRCCRLAQRTGAGVSWLCALWRCRKLAVQAACILVPASRMSTGRGILA